MAFFVSKLHERWEARESHRTPKGPRSRTLATFRELTPEVLEQIIERSAVPVDVQELLGRASRAGIQINTSSADEAASRLIREIAMGNMPRQGLVKLLIDSLPVEESSVSSIDHGGHRMKLWAGASQAERSQALIDLLELGDSLPASKRKLEAERFPKIGRPDAL